MSSSCGLTTDLYELTMTQGYYLEGNNPQVVFDMFYRSQPFGSGYAVFAGLETLLRQIQCFYFSDEDIAYLRSLGTFKEPFLSYLKNFKFTGDIHAMPEGTVIFPGEPILRLHGSLIEAQLLESIILNIINFQSLIATKTSRIYVASRQGKILEFGLRRAQGLDGALSATRAAYIGGAVGTSNTQGGKQFGIPVMGTMAHSWVMSFPSEKESFQAFARLYPDNCILLIDTYDTLYSGVPNAVAVGRQLKEQGKSIGVRIDSGDLTYLSRRVRKALDEAGLTDAKITASNDLNEEIIYQLVSDHSPIDSWGVGTNLVTGGNQSAMNGVYKLAAKKIDGSFEPTMKLSNNLEKTTNPGIKQVYRFFYEQEALADLIMLKEEPMDTDNSFKFNHPMIEHEYFRLSRDSYTHVKPLLQQFVRSGSIVGELPSLEKIREHALQELFTLDDSYKRIINPHIYKVSISDKLKELKLSMIRTYQQAMKRH